MLTNPGRSYGHHTWCRGARPVPPWACLPGRRLGPLQRVLPSIWLYLENPILKRPAKIFCEAHNFGLWWNFDKWIFVCKTWDAADADCSIARVNRTTRGRAIGTYSTYVRVPILDLYTFRMYSCTSRYMFECTVLCLCS